MFDTVISSLSCLIAGNCGIQGAGGAIPPAQILLATLVAAIAGLIVATWKSRFQEFLKSSLVNLIAVSVLAVAAMVVPSVAIACLTLAVLMLCILFYRKLRAHRLNLGRGRSVRLWDLVAPAVTLTYLLGIGVIVLVEHMTPPPPKPARTIAFFAPSRFIGTGFQEVGLADQSQLLADFDLGPKQLLSGTLSNLDIDFYPAFSREQHSQFRDRFGQTTLAQLDHWLSLDPSLRQLSRTVDIALEESATIQGTSGPDRELVVRAYINRRSQDGARFQRDTSGGSILAQGTLADRNDLMLVLAVRLAAKLLSELHLPALTPEQQSRIWTDFSQTLRNRMSDYLEARGDELSPDAAADARYVIAATPNCAAADCALAMADAFESVLMPAANDPSQLMTAAAAYEAARGP